MNGFSSSGIRARTTWWLSFVDRIDHQVAMQLGAALVPGDDLNGAIRAAWRAGCNPGGEVAGTRIPDHWPIRWDMMYRLFVEPGDVIEAQSFLQACADRDERSGR